MQRYLVPDAVLSYAALAHGMDRGMCWQTLANGGRVGICSRGEENVLDDARALNPVLFVAMPHVWTRIYLDYRQALAAELLLEESGDEAAAKQRVLARFSTILGTPPPLPGGDQFSHHRLHGYVARAGTRLMQAATGGSATSPQVMEFLRECLKCPVVDAYGTTEVGPPLTIDRRPRLWIGR
jgi:long-subunit acyl-CoA synthetase (AMP-forming)